MSYKENADDNITIQFGSQYAEQEQQSQANPSPEGSRDPSGGKIDELPPTDFVSHDESIMALSCLVSPDKTPAATLTLLPNKLSKSESSVKKLGNIFKRKPNEKSNYDQNLTLNNVLDDLSVVSENIPCNTMTITDIESALGKSYIDYESMHPSSNALDVVSLYIKGQKLLYTEAKTYCEQQLNFLMLPAIFISCVGSIFSFISEKYNYGPIVIACLNGFNAFLLSLISYLKLDAKAQAHKTSAYKFDKLESYCEFNSGKFMFFETKIEDISAVVEKIEKDVKEIKETNQFILPESIRYEFNFTYSTNVFMMIKRMHSIEMTEIHNLKNCINRLSVLKAQLDAAKVDKKEDQAKKLILELNNENIRKEQFVNNILARKREYFEIDRRFKTEIDNHMRRVNKWFIVRVICCDWLKS